MASAIKLNTKLIGSSAQQSTPIFEVSTPIAEANCMKPTLQGVRKYLNLYGWFTEYFIKFSPELTSSISDMCKMLAQIKRPKSIGVLVSAMMF